MNMTRDFFQKQEKMCTDIPLCMHVCITAWRRAQNRDGWLNTVETEMLQKKDDDVSGHLIQRILRTLQKCFEQKFN